MTVLVAGAGLAGLSAALSLGRRARVFEREARVGGTCRTEIAGRFTVDHAGHYLHFRDAEIRRLVHRMLGRNLMSAPRDSWVHLKGLDTPYPFQANTFGHDAKLIRECVMGYARARDAARPGKPGETYEDWIRRTWGPGFLRHFMKPFNEKQFHIRLAQLLPLQGGRFLPKPDPHEIVRGALARRHISSGYNAMLEHPRHGGIEVLPLAFARALARSVKTGSPLRRIHWRSRVAEFAGAGPQPYGVLVSSLPLPELLGRLDPLPPAMARARSSLRSVGVLCLHYLVRGPHERTKHWIYVPERRFSFFRVGFPANINHADAPPGAGIISAEMSYASGRRPGIGAALARARLGLRDLGVLGRGCRIVREIAVDIPCGYVVFDRAYPQARGAALRWLAARNILSIGRYGSWVYGGMEDAMREGLDTGRLVAAYGERAGARFRVEDLR
ncbi:MAG: FAD-dependent oxidoreductase [Candidatus Coatesbacteria bacterium]